MHGELEDPNPKIWLIAVPLATLTAVGMLATDLYLPAVPGLPDSIGGTLEEAQLTLSSFLATLALSQLLWGWASDKFGESAVIRLGMFLLIGASALCALTSNMTVLIIGRAIQGLGAGSATAAAPALLSKKFRDTDAVKALSSMAMIEAVVPALGPVLGAFLIAYTDWRVTFWVIVVLTALVTPFIARVTGETVGTKANSVSIWAGLTQLFKNGAYMRLAISYSLMFGALLMFVSSAPQLIVHVFLKPVTSFAIFQLFGVTSFVIAASAGGRLAEKFGIARVIRLGAALQMISCVAFLALAFLNEFSFELAVAAWCVFGLGLGTRGPSSMSRALKVAGPIAGQATGFLMFLAFGVSAAATAAIAPFLEDGLLPISLAMTAMIGASILLSLYKAEA